MTPADLRATQAQSLRQLVRETERVRAVNGIVNGQRLRTLLDALNSQAAHLERPRPNRLAAVLVCCALALVSGVGIGALVFAAILT